MKFIRFFSSYMVHLWDSTVAVCSPLPAHCNHPVAQGS